MYIEKRCHGCGLIVFANDMPEDTDYAELICPVPDCGEIIEWFEGEDPPRVTDIPRLESL